MPLQTELGGFPIRFSTMMPRLRRYDFAMTFISPGAWATKPASPSAGGAADNSPQFQLRVSPAK